jgi:hypothetical protein
VHFIWECKFKQQLKANPDQALAVKQMEVPEPMDPREAFYGGRTNCRQMYHKCKEGERIKYIDICRYNIITPSVPIITHYPITNLSLPNITIIKCLQPLPLCLQIWHVP